jgi:hypothetical protein
VADQWIPEFGDAGLRQDVEAATSLSPARLFRFDFF